jgi:hypothetical protein
MRMTFVHFVVLLVWLLPDHLFAQAISLVSRQEMQKISPTDTIPRAPNTGSQQNAAVKEMHPRLFWIMPTYAVSNNKSPVPLSSREKFRLFLKNSTDPYTIGYTAFQAGIQQANNDLPGYGQGAAGYGKRLGAGLADETSAGFFQAYLFASLLRQDPRYFRQGSGPLYNRLAHAVIRPIVTRNDSGGRTFNWSGLLGGIAASSLSNAYYPAGDRGVAPTFHRVAMGIPFSIIDHLVDEFGPDLQKLVTPRKQTSP